MQRSAVPVLVGLTLVFTVGCIERGGLGDPDGGTGSGKAGTSATGHAGSSATGAAGTGSTGEGGATGAAGTSATGVAGTTGTTGAAGVTGAAGTSPTGHAGVSGAAGTNGKAGSGGTMCPPTCAIFCPYGNVVDAKGCATCQCNPAPACKPDECGLTPVADTGAGAALPAPMCNGQLVPPSTCSRDPMTGKCVLTRPGCACPPLACGKIACPFGNKIDPTTGCTTCECNPEPAACSINDCGALPPIDYSMKCADGTIMKPTCGRSPGGMCFWSFPKCPPPVCPAIACLKACPYGSRPDANGCPTCDCIEPKACGALTDWKSCTADMRCTWLQPGCGSPSLAAGGCYARAEVGCMSDKDCGDARTCLKRVVDPCYNPAGGASCDACGQVQTVCL